MKKITILALCVTLFFSLANAKNIFVDPTNGLDTRNGTTWELAVKTLEGAVVVAKTSFAAGDNIYVKGGTLTYSAAFTSNTTANFYGSCDLSNTVTSTTRTLIDKDGNGIIEPWEFQNQTVLYSTASIASGGAANVTAFNFGGSGYTFDGFTITHVGTNASSTTTVYMRTINLIAGTIFKNNSMKYSVVTFTPSGSTAAPYEMFFRTSSGGATTVSNCLFEKNNVTYNTTTTGAAYPFISINYTNFSNCTVRNNLVTVNATAANQVRSMLIGVVPSVSPFPSVRNCLIHNNDMIYNGTGGTTSNVGATVNVYGADGNDSIVNCTIANNKSTNVPIAGVQAPNRATTANIIQNNVLWNNTYGASTVANITVSSTTSASSSVTKNFTNGGQTVTENGTTITGNNFTLSSTNDTGTNQPLFKTPVINAKVGSSLSTLTATDSTTIKQSNWKLQSSSYLINKGAYVPNSPTGVSPMDKDGKYFAISPTLPAIGAYEYKTSPNLQWSAQSDLTLTTASSAQTLSAATSDISNGSTPAGTDIVYSSDNPAVVTVSGTTLTVVGVGTTTIRAQQVGTNYETVSVTKNVTVTIPLVITGITPYNGQLSVAFTNADPTGVTNYKYSTNGGSTWTSSGQTTSPILIKGLVNGTSYNVQLKSYTTGDGLATPTTAATPNVATYLVQQGSGSSWSGSVLTGRNVVNLSTVNTGSSKSFNEWFADKSLASPTFAGASFGTGDQVWVINGTYYLTGTVTLKADVTIYGGFAGTEIPSARAKNSSDLWDFTNVTALDGSVSGTKTYIGISSASIPTTTIVDGLTIQNCTNGATNSSGGGAKIYGSGVTLQNCIVTACTATGSVATAASAGVSVLSGTLKDSYIHHNTASSSGTCAGGIAVYSDGGTVSGCKIEYNSVTGAGGGIYLYANTSGVSITNCSFSNNSATSNGGAIASYINNTTNSSAISITGCSFTSNSSSANGGAMSLAFSGTYTNNNFNVSGCTFTSNYSTTVSGNSSNGGGAICFSGLCAYTVDKCTFTGNYTTLAYGGALQITSTSSGTISNSKFNSNTAGSTTSNNGSAIYSKSNFTANNCLFADNTGINPIAFNGSSAASTFQNCTFANNLTSAAAAAPIGLLNIGAGPTYPKYVFSNCLFYKVSTFSNQTPTLTNCAFDIAEPTGATYSQTGVSTADFMDATNATIANRNYSLATGSRAIDAGTAITACSPDIANTVRPQGNAYDLGAYEYSGTNLSFATKTSMSKTYGDAVFTNAATGLPSGGAISYASANTAVATVNASTGEVTIVAIGTTVITATIAANGADAAATATYTLTVAAKALTVTTPTTASKVYDGTTTATIGGTLSGVVGTDVVTLTKAANYADKNVGTGKAITASCSISGAGSGNYTLTQPTLTSRSITAKALTMSGLLVPTSKEYDGLTTAVVTDNKVLLTAEAVGTGTTTDNKPYTNDEVSITGTAVGTYNSKDAGTATTVTYSGLSLTGAQAGNYSLTIQGTSAATITKKALTITADNQTVTYGTAASSVTGAGTYTATGFITGEDVTVIGSSPTYSTTYTNTTAAATSGVTITPIVTGLTATNYSFTPATGTITITSGAVTVASNSTLASYSPTAATDVTVNAGYELTVNADANVKTITVVPGGKLTLGTATLTVATTNGITLQSSSAGTATFVDNNTVSPKTVTGTAEQYLNAARNWYMTSPIAGATVPTGQTYYSYDESGSNNGFTGSATAYWVAVPEGTALNPMKGYIAQPGTSTTLSYNGTFNTGEKTVSLTRTTGKLKEGFNLVANPYPSYLDWQMVDTTAAKIMSSVWYRTKTTGNAAYTFDTYNGALNVATGNGANLVTHLIPPMQAFWVRVKAGQTAGTLTFTNAMRAHVDNTLNKFKAPAQHAGSQKLLRLQVSNGVNADETIICFNPNASNGFDGYDSQKWSNNSASIPEIFTVAGTEQLVINGMNSITLNQEIPLGFTTGQSNTFSIKATEVSNFDASTQVILLDNQNPGTQWNLTDGSTYNFSSDITNSNTSRFSLVFKASAVNTGNINTSGDSNSILIYRNENNLITVSCLNGILGQATVSVYNAIGQKLTEQTLQHSITVLEKSFNAGVYLVSVTANGKSTIQKVVIN